MSKSERLRALVNTRLNAAAEEICTLFERTIAEYEEELSRWRAEKQRKDEPAAHNQRLLLVFQTPAVSPGPGPGPGPGLRQDVPTSRIKEEPEEHGVKQESDPLPVPHPRLCARSEEEPSPQRHAEDADTERLHAEDAQRAEIHVHVNTDEDSTDYSDTDNDEDWSPEAAKDTKSADNSMQVQIRDNTDSRDTCAAAKLSAGHISRSTSAAKSKEHRCSFCQKLFAHKKGLVRHVRTHTGEKPYSCPICDRKFAQFSYLSVHKRTHTQERPYSCSVCMKRFSQGCNLRTHMRIHTGERRFSCPVCKKTFVLKLSRDRHLETHSITETADGDEQFGEKKRIVISFR